MEPINIYGGAMREQKTGKRVRMVEEPLGRILSTFAPTPFIFTYKTERLPCASHESLIQCLRWVPGKAREAIAIMPPEQAYKEGLKKLAPLMVVVGGIACSWSGKTHYDIIKEAFKQKMKFNNGVYQALQDSMGRDFVHNPYRPVKVAPLFDIVKIVTEVRLETFGQSGVI